MLIYLLYFFVFIVIIQLIYYVFIFGKFAFGKPATAKTINLPISVIVCAKNEEENVKKYIPLLANQEYSDFEIVLIDDASNDNTLEIFEEFEKEYANIRLVKVQNNEAFWGNKKYALTLGIKAAKKDYLLFTDADCYPTSTKWLSEMSGHFSSNKTIVLGYGAYEKIPNSFLNKVIRFETLLTAVQYFSWAKAGFPYMGIGRNLGYKKEEFFNVNGFINHIQLRSGDDDLFINQIANKKNTSLCYSPESFTYSAPKTTYKEWFNQKRRHVSTAGFYKFFDKSQLALFYFSQLSFLIFGILLVALQYEWILVASLIGLRYLFCFLVIGFSSKKLNEKGLVFLFPIIEIVLIFTQLNVFVTNIFSKPVYWK